MTHLFSSLLVTSYHLSLSLSFAVSLYFLFHCFCSHFVYVIFVCFCLLPFKYIQKKFRMNFDLFMFCGMLIVVVVMLFLTLFFHFSYFHFCCQLVYCSTHCTLVFFPLNVIIFVTQMEIFAKYEHFLLSFLILFDLFLLSLLDVLVLFCAVSADLVLQQRLHCLFRVLLVRLSNFFLQFSFFFSMERLN